MLLKIARDRWSGMRVFAVVASFGSSLGALYGAYMLGIRWPFELSATSPGEPDVFERLSLLGAGAFFGVIWSIPYTALVSVGLVLGFLLLRWLPLNSVLKTFLLTTIVTGISWFILRTIVRTGTEEIIVNSIIFATTATILWRSGWMHHNPKNNP